MLFCCLCPCVFLSLVLLICLFVVNQMWLKVRRSYSIADFKKKKKNKIAVNPLSLFSSKAKQNKIKSYKCQIRNCSCFQQGSIPLLCCVSTRKHAINSVCKCLSVTLRFCAAIFFILFRILLLLWFVLQFANF